jgi:hypothetical protein
MYHAETSPESGELTSASATIREDHSQIVQLECLRSGIGVRRASDASPVAGLMDRSSMVFALARTRICLTRLRGRRFSLTDRSRL